MGNSLKNIIIILFIQLNIFYMFLNQKLFIPTEFHVLKRCPNFEERDYFIYECV